MKGEKKKRIGLGTGILVWRVGQLGKETVVVHMSEVISTQQQQHLREKKKKKKDNVVPYYSPKEE